MNVVKRLFLGCMAITLALSTPFIATAIFNSTGIEDGTILQEDLSNEVSTGLSQSTVLKVVKGRPFALTVNGLDTLSADESSGVTLTNRVLDDGYVEFSGTLHTVGVQSIILGGHTFVFDVMEAPVAGVVTYETSTVGAAVGDHLVSHTGEPITSMTLKADMNFIDTSGRYRFLGWDVAVFEGSVGGSFSVMAGKTKRVLTDSAELQLDLGSIESYAVDKVYKIAYRLLYSPIGSQGSEIIVASEENGKDGWRLLQDGGSDVSFTRQELNQEQAAPIGLVGVAPTVELNDGQITGTTTEMEYKLKTESTWTLATGETITGLIAGTYEVRYAAKPGYNAGLAVEVEVPAYIASNQEQAAPIGIMGVAPTAALYDGQITGTTTEMEYKLKTESTWNPATGETITGLTAGTYEVRYAAKPGYNAGLAVEVEVPAYVVSNQEQSAPIGIVGVAPTSVLNDGQITGTTTEMEYKLKTESTWNPVTGETITGLTAGTYEVRYAAKPGYNAGLPVEVEVPSYIAPNQGQGIIDYSTLTPTNQNVTATLTFTSGDTITITNNGGSNRYEFSENGSFTFEFVDQLGNLGSQTAVVNNIDKVAPVISGITDGEVATSDVILTFNEGNGRLNGSEFISGTVLSSDGSYKLTVTDIAGNTSIIEFSIRKTRNGSDLGDSNSGGGNSNGSTNDVKERQAPVLIDDVITNLKITRESTEQGIEDRVKVGFSDVTTIIESVLKNNKTSFTIQLTENSSQPADRVSVDLTKEALRELSLKGITVQIDSKKGSVQLLPETMNQLANQYISISFNEVTNSTVYKDINKALDELGKRGQIVGKPLQIKSNIKGNTKVILPLEGIELPSKTDGKKLAVLIQHSDGENEIVFGEIIFDQNKKPISFAVNTNKFSIFTVISIDQQEERLIDIDQHWAGTQIRQLVSSGIISGYPDGTFKPKQTITRAEFITLIVRALEEKKSENTKTFIDIQNHWAKNEIEIAASNDIVNGLSEDYFAPDQEITREQMAAMIVNAGKLKPVESKSEFKDYSEIASWAEESINTAAYYRIITGLPNQTFNPKGKATRAEAAVVINNLLNLNN